MKNGDGEKDECNAHIDRVDCHPLFSLEENFLTRYKLVLKMGSWLYIFMWSQLSL